MPSTSTLPEVGSSRRLMHLSSVLFPEPERPKITTTSPGPTSRFTPLSTSLSPNTLRTQRRLTTGRASVPMRTTALPDVAPGEPSFEAPLEIGEDARQEPVDQGRDHQRLQVLKVLAANLRRPKKELLGADDTNQRRVLDHGYKFVARRRDADPDRLRKQDSAHRLRPRHPQGLRRLDLPVPDRLDAGTENLRRIRPVVDAECQHPGGDSPQYKKPLERARFVLGALRKAEVYK